LLGHDQARKSRADNEIVKSHRTNLAGVVEDGSPRYDYAAAICGELSRVLRRNEVVIVTRKQYDSNMIASRHLEIFVMIFASILAIYVGSQIVTLPIPLLAILLAAIFLFVWSLTAGNAWWVPVFIFAQVLGVFKFGVKVSPSMVGVGLAVLGLVPLVLVQNEKVLQRTRRPLPFIFYATALYIFVRLVVDIIPAEGSRTNLYRLLFDALWPFFFIFIFHHYGNLSTTRAALVSVLVVVSIRCIASIVGYITSIPIYIPGIDYLLSLDSDDALTGMRQIGLSLLILLLIFFHSAKSTVSKIAYVPFILGSCFLVLMGKGRFATFMMFMLPTFFFAWSRRWLLLLLAASVAVGAICLINVAPQALDKLDPSISRALSGLIFVGVKTEAQEKNIGSDEWHQMMKEEGYRRWTETPANVLFGYGIRATPDYYSDTHAKAVQGEIVKQAANLGAFECGLWTMLALFGLVGMGLYTLLFIYLWRQIFPYFFRRPTGTFWEGILFWAGYSSLAWYAVSDFQGSFPGMELILMVLAADAVQDGKLEEEKFENRPPLDQPPRFMQLGPPVSRA
jgi:hypothetical protein